MFKKLVGKLEELITKAPRDSLAGLQSTVTALPCTDYKTEVLFSPKNVCLFREGSIATSNLLEQDTAAFTDKLLVHPTSQHCLNWHRLPHTVGDEIVKQ